MPERNPSIFISYRGGDAEWAPDLVHIALAEAFGSDAVFKAGFSLLPGDEYPQILEDMAASCPVMLVCIGRQWLTAQNPDGTRRLDDTDDWVRREIELALRNGNKVIPLLLGNHGDITIPAEEDLPPNIAPLARRQAFRLEPGGRLRITLPDLVARVADLVPSLTRRRPTAPGTITAKLQIGSMDGGKAAAVRMHEGALHSIDADVNVDTLSGNGEATVVDLLPRDRGPER